MGADQKHMSDFVTRSKRGQKPFECCCHSVHVVLLASVFVGRNAVHVIVVLSLRCMKGGSWWEGCRKRGLGGCAEIC